MTRRERLHRALDAILDRPIIVYHGTTQKRLASILEHGFRPDTHFARYVATAHNYAHWASKRVNKHSAPVVIAVNRDHPSMRCIKPYEDRYYKSENPVPAEAVKGWASAGKKHSDHGYKDTIKNLKAKNL